MWNTIPRLLKDKLRVYSGWKIAAINVSQDANDRILNNNDKKDWDTQKESTLNIKNSHKDNTCVKWNEMKSKEDINKQLIELYKSEKFKRIQKIILETQEYAEMVTRENAILRAKVESGKWSSDSGHSYSDLNLSRLTEAQLDQWVF